MSSRVEIARRHALVVLNAGIFVLGCCLGVSRAQDDTIQRLSAVITGGPTLYRTPEAMDYYSKRGLPQGMAAPQQQRDDAIRSLRATIKLGDMGSRAKDAIPTLIDMFPQLEHVIAKRGVHYTTGNGSLEDWVQTFLVSEKSNFVFSSPFVEFETMSKCESCIEATPVTTMLFQKIGSGGRVVEAVADIFIILRVNAGACALSRITGKEFGSNRDAWQRWWYQESGKYSGAQTPLGYQASATPRKKTFGDIIAGGRYKLHLVTGDDLAGTIVSRDDTSLVLKTESGAPYSFAVVLIDKYEITSAPPPPVAPPKNDVPAPQPAAGASVNGPLTFDDLARGNVTGKMMEIQIKNGSVFRGTLTSAAGDVARINVEGSEIPVSRGVITKIILIPK
jgi:hypothetical protein